MATMNKRVAAKVRQAADKRRADSIGRIATTILGIETLKTRNSDGLDFHDLAVWQIKKAMEDAYNAGRQSAWWPVGLTADRK